MTHQHVGAHNGGSSEAPLPPWAITLGELGLDIYLPLAKHIKSHRIVDYALKRGQRVPDFVLPDDEARLVSSRQLLARGPLILFFVSGSWCSFCAANLKSLSLAQPTFKAFGATLVAITPELGNCPRHLKRLQKLSITVLSDVDFGVSLSFGLLYAVPTEIQDLMTRRGVDLSAMQGASRVMLSVPATYVIGVGGVVLDAIIYADYATALRTERIVDALRRCNCGQAVAK